MRYWILLLLASAFGAHAQTPSAEGRLWHCGPKGCSLSCANAPRQSDLKRIQLETLANGALAFHLHTWRNQDSFWLVNKKQPNCRLTGDLLTPSSQALVTPSTSKPKAAKPPRWLSKGCFGNRPC